MKFLAAVAALCCLLSAPAFAALKVGGHDDTMSVDTSSFPPEMKASYALMTSRCTKCHSLQRIVLSYTTGVAPVSNQPFDMEFLKSTVFNMFRKSEAKQFPVSKDERKSIFSVLKYMLEESAR